MRSLNIIQLCRYSKLKSNICHYNQYGFATFTLSINKKMNSGQFYTVNTLKN